MIATVITPPEPLVSLERAKQHLHVEHDDADDLIELYIAAASAHIDGPFGWLGRAIGLQTLEARFDRFGCDLVRLPYGPLISIVSVIYDDSDGVAQTLDAASYSLDQYGALVAYDSSWPTARLRSSSVRVRYLAGYVVDAGASPLVAAVPKPVEAAVLLMVGDLWANRETVSDPTPGKVAMSTTVENLLGPFRIWAL